MSSSYDPWPDLCLGHITMSTLRLLPTNYPWQLTQQQANNITTVSSVTSTNILLTRVGAIGNEEHVETVALDHSFQNVVRQTIFRTRKYYGIYVYRWNIVYASMAHQHMYVCHMHKCAICVRVCHIYATDPCMGIMTKHQNCQK